MCQEDWMAATRAHQRLQRVSVVGGRFGLHIHVNAIINVIIVVDSVAAL
jgi:hypothetical protein